MSSSSVVGPRPGVGNSDDARTNLLNAGMGLLPDEDKGSDSTKVIFKNMISMRLSIKS